MSTDKALRGRIVSLDQFRGYTVVNSATVIVTHLTKLIQEHAYELIGRQEVHALVDGLKRDHEKVVEEVIATDRLNLGGAWPGLEERRGPARATSPAIVASLAGFMNRPPAHTKR